MYKKVYLFVYIILYLIETEVEEDFYYLRYFWLQHTLYWSLL